MIWISILLMVSALFNVVYCIRIIMKDEYIRRADNGNKMLRDRIEELSKELDEYNMGK